MPYVGGPAWAHVLLNPLESLSAVEETVVREKAVQSLCEVGSQLPESSVDKDFCALVKARRASSDAQTIDTSVRRFRCCQDSLKHGHLEENRYENPQTIQSSLLRRL